MTLGRIFIAAVAEGEAFDNVAHARTDWDVIEYTLSRQDENSFWQCECEVIPTGGSVYRPLGRSLVHISEEVDGVVRHVFTGRVEGWPVGSTNKPVTLTIKGKPAVVYLAAAGADVTGAAAERYDQTRWIYSSPDLVAIKALETINDDPWFVFSDPTDKRTPEMVLASRSALLHWTRDDTAPVLADLLQGDGEIDIADNYIDGSLEFDQPSQPIANVEVTIRAEWANALVVRVNLAESLQDRGIPPYFGSLSSTDWSSFPRVGTKVGDWTVTRSAITPMGGPANVSITAPVVDAPAAQNMDLDASNTAATRPLTFQRRFYAIDLEAATVLKANRRETLKFRLSWGGQDIAGYQGTTEKVELECRNLRRNADDVPQWPGAGTQIPGNVVVQQDGSLWKSLVPHVARASLYMDMDKWDPLLVDGSPVGGEVVPVFFGGIATIGAITPSGNQQLVTRTPIPGLSAIRYALLQARAKIISGVRIVKASLSVPWEDVRDITGRELLTVTLSNGRRMTGKIVSVSAQLVKGICTIQIAAAPGNGGQEPVIGRPDYPYVALTTPGIVSSDIVNSYSAQEAALAALQASNAKVDFARAIEQIPTRFVIDLAPTSGTAELPVDLDLGTFFFDCESMVDLSND